MINASVDYALIGFECFVCLRINDVSHHHRQCILFIIYYYDCDHHHASRSQSIAVCVHQICIRLYKWRNGLFAFFSCVWNDWTQKHRIQSNIIQRINIVSVRCFVLVFISDDDRWWRKRRRKTHPSNKKVKRYYVLARFTCE